MFETYEDLPTLHTIVDIQIYSNVFGSEDLQLPNYTGTPTQRELDFKQFLETIYKQIRDENGGCLDIVENHFTNRKLQVSNYIFAYYVVGKLTMFQYLIELRISDHSTQTHDARRKYFRQQANDWDMLKTHDPDDYKDLTNHNNARYIPIDVCITTKWTSNNRQVKAHDVNYLQYSSYQDALNYLTTDILSLLQSIPQLGVIGYKNRLLYKTKRKNEYVVFTDVNHRNILVSGTLDEVCEYIDTLNTSNQSITSAHVSQNHQDYLNDIASDLEYDLGEAFSTHTPFRCVKAYVKNNKLILCILDDNYGGFTFEFDINADYDNMYSEIYDAFDESYQYDDI